MTKREYAEEIVNILENNGQKYKITEVNKTNGIIKTGITLDGGPGIYPTVYVDEAYEHGDSVEKAAQMIDRMIEEHKNVGFDYAKFTDYEAMKGNLRARLYNKTTYAEVYRSAKAKGFDDLIIVPYVMIPELTEQGKGVGGFKVTNNILETWGVTKREVIDTALKNSKAEMLIQDMVEMMIDIGMPEEMAREMNEDNPTVVITNTSKLCGAIAILFAREKLRRMFPNGYVILPSSVHEVIAVPYTGEDLSHMVREVNVAEVSPEERLGNKAYVFAA